MFFIIGISLDNFLPVFTEALFYTVLIQLFLKKQYLFRICVFNFKQSCDDSVLLIKLIEKKMKNERSRIFN